MIGLSGTLIGGIQFGVLEGKAITEVDFSPAVIGLLAGFVASMAIFYSLVPVLIKYVPASPRSWDLLASCHVFGFHLQRSFPSSAGITFFCGAHGGHFKGLVEDERRLVCTSQI